jgi:hypothetical protein
MRKKTGKNVKHEEKNRQKCKTCDKINEKKRWSKIIQR